LNIQKHYYITACTQGSNPIQIKGARRAGNVILASLREDSFGSYVGEGLFRATLTDNGGKSMVKDTGAFVVVDSRTLGVTWLNGSVPSDSLFSDQPFTVTEIEVSLLPKL
jgi:hypothetical protein